MHVCVMVMSQALALASLMSGRFVRSDKVAVSGSIDLRGTTSGSAIITSFKNWFKRPFVGTHRA